MSHRFTVSLHRVGERGHADDGRGDHLDWFFAVNRSASEPLLTWSTPLIGRQASDIAGWRLPDHRARYLDYDGDISGDRGQVQRLVTGTYQLIAQDAERMELMVKSVAVVDALAASSGDQDIWRLAARWCELLVASEHGTIRLVSQGTHREG